MGNDLVKINTIGNVDREAISKSYDTLRGNAVEEEVSIWNELNPGQLAIYTAFPLVMQRKEFQSVKMDPTLAGKELCQNKYRMMKVNEVGHSLDKMKIKKIATSGSKVADPFLNSEWINLKDQVKTVRSRGSVSKETLKSLNKQYYELLSKNLDKKSFIQKILTKFASKFPNIGGSILKSYKANALIALLYEIPQEIQPIMKAFSLSKEDGCTGANTGCKQLVKSTGRVAAGFAGFIAGAALGGKIGALLGSVIPGAGTLIGGAIGSALGFAVGGVTSHLARKAYNAVVKDETEIVKDKELSIMLDENNKSKESKELLSAELLGYEALLKDLEEGKVKAQEMFSNQETTEEAKNFMTQYEQTLPEIQSAYNSLLEVYQRKFGERVVQISNANNDTTKETAAVNIASQNNPTAAINNQNIFSNGSFTNTSIQTDWSALLPAQTQHKLFAAIA